jgi:hypothetical protein
MSVDSNTRIKYAFYSNTWNSATESREKLVKTSSRIAAIEYSPEMRNRLYCPGCYTQLVRTPLDKPIFTNGRKACFAHLPKNRSIPCDLRSTKPEGMLYQTFEDAPQAVAEERLIVISSFMREPMSPTDPSGVYDQTPVEDASGPTANVPISRHSGKKFNLPTKISTIASVCRRFDLNLYRYFLFPGDAMAYRLLDILTDVRKVTEPTQTPKLYFGKIAESFNAGKNASNIRMTKLLCNQGVKDFYIKVVDRLQTEKGISDSSKGRHLIFWGTISGSGIGLCAQNLAWGEFALLPQIYDDMLPSAED